MKQWRAMPLTAGALPEIVDLQCDGFVFEPAPGLEFGAANIEHLVAACRSATPDSPVYTRLDCRAVFPDGPVLRAIACAQPCGIVLSGFSRLAELQRLHVGLDVAEAEAGVEIGSTRIVALVGHMPCAGLLAKGFVDITPRLSAVIFDGAALAVVLAAGVDSAAVSTARGLCLLQAAEAHLPAFERHHAADRPTEDCAGLVAQSAKDGFSGVVF